MRRQLGAVLHPPDQNGHEGTSDVLHRQVALLGRALEANGLEVDARKIRDRAVNALQHEGAALSAHHRPVERQVTAGMLQHREAEAETSLP